MTHIGFSAWPLLDLFLVGGVTFDAQLDLFQASLPQHQLGHFSVLHVLEKPVKQTKIKGDSIFSSSTICF